MATQGRQLTTRLDADGTLTLSLSNKVWNAPTGREILVEIEAAPINPSDLRLLIGSADIESAEFTPGTMVARMPADTTGEMHARHGLALPAGNEGAGIVVAAGDDPAAQTLLGKRVACVPGTAFATHAICDAAMAFAVSDDVSAEQAASSFVNPMTALAFTETMKAEGFTGIVHAAAASNLGQMLVRICAQDGIPLVNIVRRAEQVAILKELGATHVIDMSEDGFIPRLADAITETGAMLGFDPIGGGTMAGRMLTAMEITASRGMEYSRYGSSAAKKVYVYGGLDRGPIVLERGFGFAWDVGGWLLPNFLTRSSGDVTARMRARVQKDLTTTFASHYSERITLDQMLTRDVMLAYAAQRTGQKFLVTPGS